jgi:hypothetical protein
MCGGESRAVIEQASISALHSLYRPNCRRLQPERQDMMYYQQKIGPRFEYRDEISRQVNSSPSLAEKYPQLKSLEVNLGHFSAKGVTRNSQIKFTPNLDMAHSLFRVDCPNQGCIGGDFDLSKQLAKAVAEHQTTISDEVCCQGWLSQTHIDSVHCHNILRFTLNLTY